MVQVLFVLNFYKAFFEQYTQHRTFVNVEVDIGIQTLVLDVNDVIYQSGVFFFGNLTQVIFLFLEKVADLPLGAVQRKTFVYGDSCGVLALALGLRYYNCFVRFTP